MLDVVDLLAVGEPVPLDAMSALTAPAALEQAELRGLVRIVTVPRLTLAPGASVVRRGAAVRDRAVRARRLRGLVATALSTEESPAEALRCAVLTLDSDLRPDPGRLLAAAHQAVGLFDLTLGERLARAAAESGGGVDARLAQAFALSWLSRGEEAEEILAGCRGGAQTPRPLHVVTGGRLGNLFWTLRRTDEAERLLAATLAGVEGPLHAFFTALRVAFDASLGRVRRAYDDGLALLDDPDLPAIAVLMAASGVAASGAVLGQVEVVKQVAVRGYDAAAKSAEGGIPRFGLADWHILALRLSGDVKGAEEVARRVGGETVDVLGPAHLMGLVLLGHGELARGRVRTAERLLREAWAGLRDSGHEFRYRCRMHLTQVLALLGDTDEARESAHGSGVAAPSGVHADGARDPARAGLGCRVGRAQPARPWLPRTGRPTWPAALVAGVRGAGPAYRPGVR